MLLYVYIATFNVYCFMYMLEGPGKTGYTNRVTLFYSLTHSLTHSLTYLLIYLLTHTWKLSYKSITNMIKFPFKRKGLTSRNVKFLKYLLENSNGQFKADNKSTILHPFLNIRKALHRSETTTYLVLLWSRVVLALIGHFMGHFSLIW